LSTNQKTNKGLQLFFAAVPLLLSFLISLISFFAAVFIRGVVFHTDLSSSEATDSGLVYLINFTMQIVIFGFWYIMILQERAPFSARTEEPVKKRKKEQAEWHPVRYWATRLPILLLLGYGLQLAVSAIISILSTALPSLFESYKELIQSLAGEEIDWMTFVAVSFLAPVGEECMFRGITLHYAKGALSTRKAILVQAVFFGIYHLNLIQFVYALVIGYLLGILADRAGSILPGIVLHSIINLSAYLIPSVFLDNIPKAALSAVLALGVVIPCCIVMFKKPKKRRKTGDNHNK